MAQVFQSDAQQGPVSDVPIVGTTETAVLRTNPLQPPFQTAKAKVVAIVNIALGSDQTDLDVSIYRNPDDENVLINSMDFSGLVSGSDVMLAVGGVDKIPDPRQVTYLVTVKQAAGTADGNIYGNSQYIEATLLSG